MLESHPDLVDILADLRALSDRAGRGDLTALPLLRRLLDEHTELADRIGDLAGHAKTAWLKLLDAGDTLMREAVERRLEVLAAELSGSSPSAIERLLVERVIVGYLQAAHADLQAAQPRDRSLKQAEFLLKQQDRAQRRLIASLGALATAQRLLPGSGRIDPVGDARPRLAVEG